MADAMLVGSANVNDAEELFRLVGETSPQTFARIPDGERGRRRNWLAAQGPFLADNDTLEAVDTGPNRYGSRGQVGKRFKPKHGVLLENIELDLPYAEDAADSFATLRNLQDQGVLPDGLRLQVCMPTAMATCLALLAPDVQREMLTVVERALARQVEAILAELPHGCVAIQWDVAAEFMHLELAGGSTFSQDEIVAALARLAALVPDDVECGFHLCYGDAPPEPGSKGKHFVEPADAGRLVAIANGVTAAAPRRIDWLHMPVPIGRDDDAYFAPLATLRLAPETRLYLGLVHEEDGMQGAQRRIAAAARFVQGFGVATECGMQNEPQDAQRKILEIQRDVIVPA